MLQELEKKWNGVQCVIKKKAISAWSLVHTISHAARFTRTNKHKREALLSHKLKLCSGHFSKLKHHLLSGPCYKRKRLLPL